MSVRCFLRIDDRRDKLLLRGGLYAQLISNTSFTEDRNGHQPNPWTPWKPADLSIGILPIR